MGDIEFISELVIGLMYGPQGGAGSIIDEYYRQFEPYEGEFPGQKEAKRLYDRRCLLCRAFSRISRTRGGATALTFTLFSLDLASFCGEMPYQSMSWTR